MENITNIRSNMEEISQEKSELQKIIKAYQEDLNHEEREKLLRAHITSNGKTQHTDKILESFYREGFLSRKGVNRLKNLSKKALNKIISETSENVKYAIL